jgi:hypothetical protein
MVKAILLELDEVFERDRLLAFDKHDQETEDRFHLAASCSDEWVRRPHSHFRMWYICRGKTVAHILNEESKWVSV